MSEVLILRFYKTTGLEIANINKQNQDYKRYKVNLPRFVYNLKEESFKESENWFQFYWDKDVLTKDQKEEEHILFDFIYATPLLSEEINNGGIEDVLEQIVLKKEDIENAYYNTIHSGDIPTETIFKIKMEFIKDWENDYSLEYEIIETF